MADKKEKKEGKMSAEKIREFLSLAMKRLKKGVDATKHNVTEAKEDLNFLNGDQWEKDEKERRKRRKRVTLTINMLPDKVDRVVGDMRQNRAKVKIRPASSTAIHDIALIREGIIRDIEYRSFGAQIYDYAGSRMVECGEGAWRVLTRWCEDNPFVQEVYLKVIKNSFMVVIDPSATGIFKEDAKWGFILSKIPREEFKEQYPGKDAPSDSMPVGGQGMGNELWYDTDTITIAEYFVVKMKKKTMALMDDGMVMELSQAEKKIKDWEEDWIVKSIMSKEEGALAEGSPSEVASPEVESPPPPSGEGMEQMQQPPQMGMGQQTPMGGGAQPIFEGDTKPGAPPKPKILKEKETSVREVRQYTITACDILEGPTRFPGKYIPIIKVYGKERNIEGKDFVRGLVRDAKDPQKLVNYWNTSAAETIALAPKAPWIGTAKQFEGYEGDYANANVENFPFLKYNVDPAAPGPPMRNSPGEPPVAIFTQIQTAERNLNRVVGTGLDLREVAPDASAKSLVQRQKPAELATFPFVENLALAQLYTYMIINEMIPEVYDTERDVEIRREDETTTYIPVNMAAEDAAKLIEGNPGRYRGLDADKIRKAILQKGQNSRFNDIGTGEYEVVVDIGPSYATQRQEASEKFAMLAQTNPALWKIAGDLIVKTLDVQGADEMANRLRKTIPPNIITLRPGEKPTPPMPSPQAKLLMEKAQTEKVKQQKELAKVQVELVKQKTELIKQYLATQETDGEIRGRILEVLSELHTPEIEEEVARQGQQQ